jgi:hypothetical protein
MVATNVSSTEHLLRTGVLTVEMVIVAVADALVADGEYPERLGAERVELRIRIVTVVGNGKRKAVEATIVHVIIRPVTGLVLEDVRAGLQLHE